MADNTSGEFDIIRRYFRPLAGPEGLGLVDDAALLDIPPGQKLVVSADTLVEGIHFFPDDQPGLIARKALRCNLSDLAAMGAVSHGYLLTFARPDYLDEQWIAAFAQGLAQDQDEFGLALLGGDTTRSPGPLVLGVTILGLVPYDVALRRSTARPGDLLWVSGTIGDAALGLQVRHDQLEDPDGTLSERYLLPQPRLALGRAVRGIASAAMDVSDGLVQDCGHIALASSVGIVVHAESVPASPAAEIAGPRWLETRLTGGDDYELLLTCPAAQTVELRAAADAVGTALTLIGEVTTGSGVEVRNAQGEALPFARRGWQHF